MAYDFKPLSSIIYRVEGGWEELCADIMEIWGTLTHEDMAAMEADHNRLVARLKMRYGMSTREAEAEIERKLGRERHREPHTPA